MTSSGSNPLSHATQFGFPFLLAVGYSFHAAVGNAYSLRDFSSSAWLMTGHVFVSAIPYLISLPCYVSLMLLYSMSRLHDLSWGTRDTSAGDEMKQRQKGIERVSADFSRDILLYNGFVIAGSFCLDLIFGPASTALILAVVSVGIVLPSMIHVFGSMIHLTVQLTGIWRTILGCMLVWIGVVAWMQTL